MLSDFTLVSGGGDNLIKLWNVTTGLVLKSLKGTLWVKSLLVLLDDTLIIVLLLIQQSKYGM
jgi:WD40 repeat protein